MTEAVLAIKHWGNNLGVRLRGGAPHPMKSVTDARFADVLALLNRVVQLA